MFGKNEPQDFDRAASYLGPACRGGAGWACHNAAQLAEKGLGGVAKDLNVIIGLHASACDAGIGLSCRRAGEVLVGQSSSEYRQMGVDMLLNGCLSSTWADVSNCFSLYMVRDRDALSGMTANVPPQAELLSRACDPSQRDNEAYGNACRAAQSACNQGEEAFCPAAFAAARLACEDPNRPRCRALADLANAQREPAARFADMAAVLRKQCLARKATACTGFAENLLQSNALGQARNSRLAEQIFQEMCQQATDFEACYHLAGMDMFGRMTGYFSLCDADARGNARNEIYVARACVQSGDHYATLYYDQVINNRPVSLFDPTSDEDLKTKAEDYYRRGCPASGRCGNGKLKEAETILGRRAAQEQMAEHAAQRKAREEQTMADNRGRNIDTCAAFLQRSIGAPSIAALRTECARYKLRSFCYEERGLVYGVGSIQNCGNLHCLKDAVEKEAAFRDGFEPTYSAVVAACLGSNPSYDRVVTVFD